MPAPAWRVRPLSRFHWRRWDDGWVVFDEGSGDTHRMDAFSAVALMCLAEEPCDVAELSRQVADETDLPLGQDLSDALGAVIERFSGLGLIEPAAP